MSVSDDPTREELVARFRDRIALGERTKLSRQERSELALHFVDRLARCQSEEEAIALCEAEISLLEEGYPVGSIANQYLPEWRKVIALAVEEGRLPKQELEPNAFGKVYAHWGLKYLLYSNEVHRALKEKTTVANNQKQDDLQPIRANRFIAKARDLLEGETPYEWAVGLLAVTGRRFSEIVAMGEFKSTAHPYAIAFRGQLKKGVQNLEAAQTFLIATLIESDNVLLALDKFRAHPRIQALVDLEPDDINARLNTSVRYYIRREFEESEVIPVLRGEKGVSAHNLRGCYAEIAVHYFCPPNQSTHRFVQTHLGHVIGERELASRKNAGATEHYFHYRLIGAQGQQLNEKGILLERFGALPTTVEPGETVETVESVEVESEQSERLEYAVIEAVQEQQPMAIAPSLNAARSQSNLEALQEQQLMAIAPSQSPARKSRTHVPSDLMHELREVVAKKLEVEGSYAEVLEAVIQFMQDDKTPAIASSIESFGSTFQWFTREIERLREEGRSLTAERDQARAELKELQERGVEHEELEALRRENQRLKAEVEQFQQVKRMLGGTAGGTGENKENGGEAIAPAATPVALPAPPTKQTSASLPRRVREDKQGEQASGKISVAIDLIMAWNDDPNHDFDSKWFISVPTILGVIRGSGFSASQGKVQDVMKHRKQDIEDHHLKHGLGQRHNVRHDKPITEDVRL
ncbi:protelomerase family protein [Leptolyngbya sp. AN02str]|uniref:protelomerase family protein n=1 Tax=Leptolyngbya sp. AN02str TaxID=3423363 RepID=UPI003D316026